MPRPVLVKLGGAVLTDKDQEASFRKPIARRLLSEVHKGGTAAIVVHGAGSFGHPVASRVRIGDSRPKPPAVAEVLASVGQLHAQVVALAQETGLPAVSVPIHATSRSVGARLELPLELIAELLQDGFVPMLCGNLVRDDESGWRIAGGDEIMANLALELPGPVSPRVACFVTDVDGIYDRDPKQPGATLVPKAQPDFRLDGAAGKGDMTGRMAGKLTQAREVATRCPVLILNGLEKNRLLDAVRGKPVVGTWVE